MKEQFKLYSFYAMSYKENYEPPKMTGNRPLVVESVILAGSEMTVTANGQEYVDLTTKYNDGSYWE